MLWNRDAAMAGRWPDLGNTITSLSAATSDITFLLGGAFAAQRVVANLSFPELTELRRHQTFVSDRLVGEPTGQGKLVQTLDCFGRNARIVERRVARDQAGDQRHLLRREKAFGDRRRQRRIGFERLLRLHDRAHRGGRGLRLFFDQPLGRGQRGKIIPARARRPVAAAQIEMDFGDAGLLAKRDPHAVAPITVGKILPDGLDTGMAHEASGLGRRRRHDLRVALLHVQSRFGQQMPQAENRRFHRRGNTQAFERVEIAALDIEVSANGQKPVGILRQRAQQLGALPSRKRAGRRIGRTAEEMQRAVAQSLRPGPRAELAHELDVDALLLEESQISRGNRDEIRGRIQIGDRKLEHLCSPWAQPESYIAFNIAPILARTSVDSAKVSRVMASISSPLPASTMKWRWSQAARKSASLSMSANAAQGREP